MTSLPLLPTSVVGSHGLPGWVWLAREALEAGRLGATDIRELIEDATQAALLDQERAGVDVLTTGEMGRVRFIIGFYDRFHGHPRARPRRASSASRTGTPTRRSRSSEKLTAPDGPRHRRGVHARALAHDGAAQGHRARPVHAPPAAQARQRLSRPRDPARRPRRHRQRGVPRPRRGRRRLHPDRRAPPAACTRARCPTSPRASTARWRASRRRSPSTSASATSTGGPSRRSGLSPRLSRRSRELTRLADRARVRQSRDGRRRRSGRSSRPTRSSAPA